ncbi:MAG: anaerobic ribonucleoside triphosphate reductase, partial [Deferribacteraceae bacterium]|nr:anaerobic ribonucleoside triphosphate reductase [Deferribacteraceae bacterium]
MIKYIEKRNGEIVDYDPAKISNAVLSAFVAVHGEGDYSERVERIAQEVGASYNIYAENHAVPVEEVQDDVEKALMRVKEYDVAKAYILYRKKREGIRKKSEELLGIYKDLVTKDAIDSAIKRENANIDGDTAMGTMLKFGSEGAKLYYETDMIDPAFAQAHQNGDIHIHDEDFYALTMTCCQIDLVKLLKGGFSTGYGRIREPNNIHSYASLACIAIQANQNDQHGGQSVPNFDYAMAPGVAKSFIKEIARCLDMLGHPEEYIDSVKILLKDIYRERGTLLGIRNELAEMLNVSPEILYKAYMYTRNATLQAMEALIHNLNTMHSRAGAQIPFSSLNYGTDTSEEGRLVIECILKTTLMGLGGGETPIFPIQIFKVKDGISGQESDPNYDLFVLACKVSAKRLFPNFAFLDAPFNSEYYVPGRPETEVGYMGCRTRVLANVYDPAQSTTYGRGNLSFTSINLPRIALRAYAGEVYFWDELNRMLELTFAQLLERFEVQARRKVRNFPFLMGQGIWLDSDKLGLDDDVREVIKHGSLTIGFIGLAECLKAMTGAHHGESQEAWELGYSIISFMRKKIDEKARASKLNFTLIATPAEGLSGRFVGKDRKLFGNIAGVTDRSYYTNSFHIPV